METVTTLENLASLCQSHPHVLSRFFSVRRIYAKRGEHEETIKEATDLLNKFTGIPYLALEGDAIVEMPHLLANLVEMMASRGNSKAVRDVIREMLDLMDRVEAQYRGE